MNSYIVNNWIIPIGIFGGICFTIKSSIDLIKYSYTNFSKPIKESLEYFKSEVKEYKETKEINKKQMDQVIVQLNAIANSNTLLANSCKNIAAVQIHDFHKNNPNANQSSQSDSQQLQQPIQNTKSQ